MNYNYVLAIVLTFISGLNFDLGGTIGYALAISAFVLAVGNMVIGVNKDYLESLRRDKKMKKASKSLPRQ